MGISLEKQRDRYGLAKSLNPPLGIFAFLFD